jgi:small subunit ribosomal protein S6
MISAAPEQAQRLAAGHVGRIDQFARDHPASLHARPDFVEAEGLLFPRLSAKGPPSGARAQAFGPGLLYSKDGRRQPEGRPQWAASAIGQEKEQRHMPLYEHVFLARQDLAQAQVDALAETATKIIEDQGGKVVRTETWGLRNIAYRIQKNRKAHYVALDFDAPAPAVAELERQTQINEDVIRYLTIKVDEHEQGPSAMMRRGDRDKRRDDERGDRGDRGDRGPRRGRDDYEM